ncbi:MAG: tRNA (adenosine(37)-N6)-threonylcarbamoyltransferase complex ATPase subunit type 1 TsaE [candidate division Zixibacteria bacterium]|nr:tRNA (adenosine(37)-N6)-threonylcarbamoyltransferase complex ATPase subunit type 1 TsaE [candidate division Zixibacteria bacterium]
MKALEIISHSESETKSLAQKLAATFPEGEVLVLRGALGSGKTTFVKGLAIARGIEEATVSSPTYTVVNEYPSERPIFHFDLYRINDPTELYEIGWDDYIGRTGLTVVEWGEKAQDKLPSQYYLIDFSIVGETERKIVITRIGS